MIKEQTKTSIRGTPPTVQVCRENSWETQRKRSTAYIAFSDSPVHDAGHAILISSVPCLALLPGPCVPCMPGTVRVREPSIQQETLSFECE